MALLVKISFMVVSTTMVQRNLEPVATMSGTMRTRTDSLSSVKGLEGCLPSIAGTLLLSVSHQICIVPASIVF